MTENNPYESPEAANVDPRQNVSFGMARADAPDNRLDRIFVRTVGAPIGVNLLGALLVMACVLLAWGAAEIMTPGNWLGAVLFFAGFVGSGLADIFWRIRRSRKAGLLRFVLPFEGAAIGYLPVYVWMFGILIALAVFVIVRLTR